MYKYIEQPLDVSGEDENKINQINDRIIGYSSKSNWHFFDIVLANPDIKNICIFGVYHGRDIAYLSSILSKHNKEGFITGVDKFKDEFGEDWPEEKRSKSWEDAGYGKPPAIETTRNNLQQYPNIELIQDTAQHYLQVTPKKFDMIYIDVAHDYKTTKEVIALSIPKLTEVGVICGDDYQDDHSCKVKTAVYHSFKSHQVHHNWFWLSNKQEFNQTRSIE